MSERFVKIYKNNVLVATENINQADEIETEEDEDTGSFVIKITNPAAGDVVVGVDPQPVDEALTSNAPLDESNQPEVPIEDEEERVDA